jgi:biotin transport system substrate-specific component
MAAGTVCLYALGVAQLLLVARLSPAKALAVGVLPFLPGDAAKMAAAVFVVRILRNQPPFRGGLR